jgi:hypothetical protein
MFGPLVKQLNLCPEKADQFYNMLIDKGTKTLTAIQSGNAEDITSSDQSLETDLKSLLSRIQTSP